MNSLLADDGIRLAYRLDGPADAPVLLLVNSLGTDLRMWEPQVAASSITLRGPDPSPADALTLG